MSGKTPREPPAGLLTGSPSCFGTCRGSTGRACAHSNHSLPIKPDRDTEAHIYRNIQNMYCIFRWTPDIVRSFEILENNARRIAE